MAPTPEFVKNKSNPVGYVQSSVRDFAAESRRLIQKCKKPDGKELQRMMYACGVGFFIMGFLGYTIDLVFIPINNLIMSS
ncbi:Sec61-gamma subunit of protein translocation complex, putative [Perkinsus marinus ATCC 50983]|uniref:Sec61-gamma subunit of protein translocation complex, putative n=1 Tax=Perkinsus marinus (strain ATCC 50983 / TXsc) TaxID=423536 RepID=C5KNB5_PERM5|nr:Sec61-gamma subunit of protein translocation complex, putative [Perkinsus marinus ATCC 50983]EER14029.1 Sec61-gamma subunit of protein translocation complex, putative [Perkinsus marinus ATCC 50983]|eukprot:XP_002782234.1 Sec61-gamma subunit of protein translocation complex, putative [Perkinsus marinus ATCC 50983]